MPAPTEQPSILARSIFTARVAGIYTPFDEREITHMRRFVRQVDRLRSFSFFAHPPHRMKATLHSGGTVTDIRADAPSDEAVTAVMPIFRELYNPQNTTSATRILKLLIRHAQQRPSRYQSETLMDLKSLREELTWRRTVDPRCKLLEEDGERTPASVIDVWLNGEYFHFDEPKAAEIPEDHAVTEMMRMMLLSAIHDFRNLWTHVRHACAVVLREPTLIERVGVDP
jgi:hypothetical protein